jgi:hypothetical protein
MMEEKGGEGRGGEERGGDAMTISHQFTKYNPCPQEKHH